MQHVQMKPSEGKGSGLTLIERVGNHFDDRYFSTLKKWRGATKDKALKPSEDFETLLRLFAGREGKVDTALKRGMIDAQDNFATEGGVDWLIEPAQKATPEESSILLNKAVARMISQRVLEVKGRVVGKRSVTGASEQGKSGDVALAEQTLAELQSDPDLPAMEEIATRYRAWADANLKRLVDTQRISPELYKKIVANNGQFIAMNRVMEAADGAELETALRSATNPGSSSEMLHRLRGGSGKIKNPYESLIHTSQESIEEGDRNLLKLALVNQFDTIQ